jgi:hypothetical protein
MINFLAFYACLNPSRRHPFPSSKPSRRCRSPLTAQPGRASNDGGGGAIIFLHCVASWFQRRRRGCSKGEGRRRRLGASLIGVDSTVSLSPPPVDAMGESDSTSKSLADPDLVASEDLVSESLAAHEAREPAVPVRLAEARRARGWLPRRRPSGKSALWWILSLSRHGGCLLVGFLAELISAHHHRAMVAGEARRILCLSKV